jgi:hypothetical protein
MSEIRNGESRNGESGGRIVRTFQSPGAVVTYRAFVGFMATLIVTLLAVIGNNLQDGVADLQRTMARVTAAVARDGGRLDDQNARLERMDGSLNGLAQQQTALDHRVTVLEARQGAK